MNIFREINAFFYLLYGQLDEFSVNSSTIVFLLYSQFHEISIKSVNYLLFTRILRGINDFSFFFWISSFTNFLWFRWCFFPFFVQPISRIFREFINDFPPFFTANFTNFQSIQWFFFFFVRTPNYTNFPRVKYIFSVFVQLNYFT